MRQQGVVSLLRKQVVSLLRNQVVRFDRKEVVRLSGFSTLSLSVGCAWDIFLFLEGKDIFLIQFCLGGQGGSSFASFGPCFGSRGLQVCLHLCDGFC